MGLLALIGNGIGFAYTQEATTGAPRVACFGFRVARDLALSAVLQRVCFGVGRGCPQPTGVLHCPPGHQSCAGA
jgi:hypothetical protein